MTETISAEEINVFGVISPASGLTVVRGLSMPRQGELFRLAISAIEAWGGGNQNTDPKVLELVRSKPENFPITAQGPQGRGIHSGLTRRQDAEWYADYLERRANEAEEAGVDTIGVAGGAAPAIASRLERGFGRLMLGRTLGDVIAPPITVVQCENESAVKAHLEAIAHLGQTA